MNASVWIFNEPSHEFKNPTHSHTEMGGRRLLTCSSKKVERLTQKSFFFYYSVFLKENLTRE